MNAIMAVFFGIVLFLSFIALIFGLIKPSIVVRWGTVETKTRKKAFVTYLIVGIAAMVLMIMTTPDQNLAKNSKESAQKTTTSTSAKQEEQVKETEKPAQWNTSEVDAGKNGNVKVAVKELKKIDDIKNTSVSEAAAMVIKRPWDYYGKILTFTGRVSDVTDHAPNSDAAKALGGSGYAIVLQTADGTSIQGEIQGNSGDLKKGQQATIYGYPVGTVEGSNDKGGKPVYLLIIGK